MLTEESGLPEEYEMTFEGAVDEIEEEFLELEADLLWEQELTVQALLQRRNQPFTRTEAFSLCATAIFHGLGRDVFAALLDCCPPVTDFLTAGWVDYPVPEFWGYLGLVELAAYLGRQELLDLLLLRGGNVNCRPAPQTFPVSPLEAAVWGGQLLCVERLVREPSCCLAFTAHLQRLWAKPDMGEGQRRCLQFLAPLLTGLEYPDSGPVPVPASLVLQAAAEMDNEELFCRMCRERTPLSAEEGNNAVQMLWIRAALLGERDGPKMLLALLDAFPQAIRRRECRALLALYAADGVTDVRLIPWLKRLQGRPLPLALLSEHLSGWEAEGEMTRRAVERIESLLSPQK